MSTATAYTPSGGSSTDMPKFLTLVTVFFFWGFLAASNGVFIPFCKSHFQLTQFQSQLIDFAFYFAYFMGSLLLYVFERLSGIDILNKIGYKRGIIYGLLVSALGALLMIAAVNVGSYPFILASFFAIALGFSLQQTCAQPFAVALGAPETGSHRLNFGGGVNSFGTTVGPIVVSFILFGALSSQNVTVEIASVVKMYVGLAVLFTAVAVFFQFSNLPTITNDEHIEKGGSALKYPQLVLGMTAIFTYVGVEVTIQSNLGALLALPEFGSYKESQIAHFISLYWGSLMIGRWTGAIAVFEMSKTMKHVLTVIVPFVGFAVILGANVLNGHDVSDLYVYAVCIVIQICGFFLSQDKPARTMLIFSSLAILAMLVGLFTTGKIAVFAFISGGLCCSIMWPCIFALAVAGLGKYTSQGSLFLIMMILGGAIIPPLQGFIADKTTIHTSYWVTVVCFAYLVFYTFQTQRVLKAQGIDHDAAVGGGH
ncbi:MAG: MFS transporter [Candidatus Kapabacteria bacterium]|jgi:FHS family L-fucose permease-like MFS transporter|nr:MFS transporter [Candidatus Kapabacteria bacterium]